jgi:hypothetical protein
MEGFDKFQHGIIETLKGYVVPSMEGDQKADFARAFKNHLLDLDGPKEVKGKLTGRETFVYKLFYGFTEIANSLDTLEDIAVFIGRFPFKGTRITKERYLQFHVECYLAETYLLQQRLESYLTLLERQYKGDSILAALRKLCAALRETIKKALEGIVRTRGSHVHEARFKDNDIDRLRGIGLLARSGKDKLANAMHFFYQIEHAKIRKRWKDQIAGNNKAVRKLLNVFFDALYVIMFDSKTNALQYPSRLKF